MQMSTDVFQPKPAKVSANACHVSFMTNSEEFIGKQHTDEIYAKRGIE
jgi:hypothetical protein